MVFDVLQQDQVDSVEYYALQATEHVGSGGTELLKGTVSRTKARKVHQSPCVLIGHAKPAPVLEFSYPVLGMVGTGSPGSTRFQATLSYF